MSEPSSGVKAVSVIVAALLLVAFVYLISSTPFPHASYTSIGTELPVSQGVDLGAGMSRFMWDYRGLDLMAQTLVLFATAIACLAMLREESH